MRAVDGVSLVVSAGETVGLVGESGSGKTMLALSTLRLVPEPGRISSGSIRFDDRDVLGMDGEELRQLRGSELAMGFQDPMTALHPLMRVRKQISEAMTVHGRTPQAASAQVVPLLRRVHVPGAARRAGDYPHSFSGGMRQRVMVAMGLANTPRLLVADEITTALDTVTQAEIVNLLGRLNRDLGTAVLLITHNIALVSRMCQRVVVMYAGRVVEEGPVETVLARPQHPYTWALIRSLPDHTSRERLFSIPGRPPDASAPPSGCRFHPRCPFVEERCRHEIPPLAPSGHGSARCWVLMDNVRERRVALVALPEGRHKAGTASPSEQGRETAPGGGGPLLRVDSLATHFRGPGGACIKAVDGVSFELRRSETLAVIGESGCGKTTLARTLTRLLPAAAGTVHFEGEDITLARGRRLRALRRSIQVIFQDPYSALDPRMKVGDIVAEPLDNFLSLTRRDRSQRVVELLDRVGLDPRAADRYPHEFSGGQRQRIGVARAIALEPALIVCDEPVSALDASVQAQIVNLLADLQRELGMAYLFIAHDLAVVRHLAHRVAVMYLGRVVELADVEDLFENPQHPYTALLLASALDEGKGPSATADPGVEPPSPLDPPSGCHFHPRCPLALVPSPCAEIPPRLEPCDHSGQAACHRAGEVWREASEE